MAPKVKAPKNTYVSPWVLEPEKVKALPTVAQNAWALITPDVMILEPRINHDTFNHLPSWVQHLYRAVFKGASVEAGDKLPIAIETFTDEGVSAPHAFWIDIALCPPSERARYKELTAKANFEEAKTLLEYLELYRYAGEGDTETFRLRDAHRAWMAK